MSISHYNNIDPVQPHLTAARERNHGSLASDIEDTLVEMYRHTKILASVLFPDHFSREFDKPYDELFDAFDDPAYMKVVVGGPRGVGKSSIGGLVMPAKKILFQESHYILPTSATATLAVDQSETLKYELKHNPQINTFFGGNVQLLTDSKEQWEIDNSFKQLVRPRGAGQQVRGQKYISFRPDLLLPDDLEKKEEALSDEQREKLKDWFYSDYVLSVDRSKTDWKIFYLGTLLHEDSLLAELMDDPSWITIELPICDENYNSYFPNFIPTEDVKQADGTILQGTKGMSDEYRDKGRLDTFHMEYMVEIQASKDALFQQSMFKYFGNDDKDDIKTTIEELILLPHTESVVIVDPAKTVTDISAETGIVGIIIDYKRHALFVADIVHGKMHPNEQYDAMFDMAEKLRARVLGVEVTSLHEFVTYPIKNEMARRKVFLELVELLAKGGHGTGKGQGKLRRIGSLGPFYRQGQVYHNRSACGALEIQLLGYPKSKKKDIMDAFAYITELLEKGLRYFFHDWFDDEATYSEEGPGIEEEYKELEIYDNEPAFELVPIISDPYGH